jgi:hypothetical protein
LPISTSSSAAVECLAGLLRLEGEKLRKSDRDSVKDALQRADGWVGGIGLDQRNGGVRHARPFGQFALREVVKQAQMAQSLADIDGHGVSCFACSKYSNIQLRMLVLFNGLKTAVEKDLFGI